MRIALSGSNGYISKNLIPTLEAANHTVIRIKRDELSDIEKLAPILTSTSVVINLAGAPILQRWTPENKNTILKSRVESTENITKVINQLPAGQRPKLFISASAIGIYAPDLVHTESSRLFAKDFVSEVVNRWEKASEDLNPDVRRVVFRIGLILGREAKTIKSLLPLFKLGLGGKIAGGKQPFPFIHIDDVVKAILWTIQNQHTQGIYNLAAPENIDNSTFTKTLANLLKRPAIFTVPRFALKIALGEASSLLLNNPQVYPERLLNEGFQFAYPDIKSCMEQIVR
jgi:uncharacterized protein (TIGR01777 family)